MNNKEISDIFEKSPIIFPDHVNYSDDKPWYSPPGWNGVFLKDLISESDTDGKFSYHLVRIQENKEVPFHKHDLQWEWNVILEGDGFFELEKKKIPAKCGQTYVTPPGISHTVRAGKRDLVLIALFAPALS